MRFENQGCCFPFAIAKAFNRSYDEVCKAIVRRGGDYQAVTADIVQDILDKNWGVEKVVDPDCRVSKFKKKGTWVIAAKSSAYPQGHCVVLKNGEVIDNGSYRYWEGLFPFKIRRAWKVNAT